MSSVCSTCELAVSLDADRVKCQKCSQTHHASCVNITANDIAYLSESSESWTCSECSKKRVLRSNSTSSRGSGKTRGVNEPLTVEHFNKLLSSIQSVAADVSAIKVAQQDIRSELLRVNSVLNEHSKVISDHSTAIARHQADFNQQSSDISECLSSLENLNVSHRSISNRVNELESRVDSTLLSGNPNATTGACVGSSYTCALANEALEKLKRSYNLIIGALPESGDDDRQVRSLVNVIDPSYSQSVMSVSRIGSTSTSSRRPRLVKVMFNNVVTPKDILRNKTRLQTSEFRNVSVRDDKTPGEFRLLENLREQLKSRQDAGEVDIGIKYVKGVPAIVHRPSKN